MQGDGYDQVNRQAERAVIESFMLAARITMNLSRLVFMGLRAAKRGIQYGIGEVKNERERLLRGDDAPAIGSEQRGQGAAGSKDMMSNFKLALYQILPEETRRQVSFAEFGQTFDRLAAEEFRTGEQRAREHTASTTAGPKESERERNEFDDAFQRTSRDQGVALDEEIQRRWGPDATFDNVWQEGLKEGGVQTPEGAMVVWASASTSVSPDAKEARENAEGVLRTDPSTSKMMTIYDQNIAQGHSPWDSMSDAYLAVQPETNTTQTTYTAREKRTGEQSQSPATDKPSQSENGQGRDTQRNQPPAYARPPVSVKRAVEAGPQGGRSHRPTRPSPAAPTQGPKLS